MRVVNLCDEQYTVYIGRPGKGLDGPWGNPIRVDDKCRVCGKIHTDKGSTLPCFEKYLRLRLTTSSSFKLMFMSLEEDSVLGCFCKPGPCHGDIIIKIWNELNEKA